MPPDEFGYQSINVKAAVVDERPNLNTLRAEHDAAVQERNKADCVAEECAARHHRAQVAYVEALRGALAEFENTLPHSSL